MKTIGQSKNSGGKVIPYKKALAIFIWWAVFLTIGGYFIYTKVLKPYIVDRPYIIKVEAPKK